MATLKLSRFRHRSETSRLLFAILVVVPLGLLALAYIAWKVGILLLPIVVPIIGIFLIIRNIVHVQFLGNAVRVGPDNFPHIQKLSTSVREVIGDTRPLDIFIYEEGVFNLMLVRSLRRRAVVLNSELVGGASDQELKWIIGRFVGYRYAKKKRLIFLEPLLNVFQRLAVFNIFLYPYERAAILAGDRIGAFATGDDSEAVFSAMKKLLIGSDLSGQVNEAGLTRQNAELQSKAFSSVLARLFSPYPHMTRRVIEMQRYLETVDVSAKVANALIDAKPANAIFNEREDDRLNLVNLPPPTADPELFAETVGATSRHIQNAPPQNPWAAIPVAAAERIALRPTLFKTSVDEDEQPAPMANEAPIMIEAGKSELLPEKLNRKQAKSFQAKPLKAVSKGPGYTRLAISLVFGAAFYMATDFFLFGSEITLPGTLTYSHDMMLQLPVMTAILWSLGFCACIIARLVSGRRIAPWVLWVLLVGWSGFAAYLEVNRGTFYLDDILPLVITGSVMFASAAFLTTLLPKSRELVMS